MKIFKTISTISLAFLVLFASTSFMIDLHLCGGAIQNISLFTKADACPMEKKMPPCHKHETSSCCDDESIVHKGEDFKTYATQINIAASPCADVVQPPVLLAEIVPSAPLSKIHYYNYDPPLLSFDRTTDLQVFNI